MVFSGDTRFTIFLRSGITKPLLNRRPLLPNESLPSLLARLQEANYYRDDSAIETLCQYYMTEENNVFYPRSAETFGILATLTYLPAIELYRATFHRYAAMFTLPSADKETITLPFGEEVLLAPLEASQRFLLSPDNAQYCPRCLAENGYHQVSWLNMLTAMCPYHHCLMQRLCPKCAGKLSVLQMVVTGQCDRCRFQLAKAPILSVARDGWGIFTQTLIQSWLGAIATPEPPLQVTIPQQPVAALMELLWGLYRALLKMPEGTTSLPPAATPRQPLAKRERPLPAQVYQLYAAALKIIANWPDNFHQFLETCRQRDGVPTGQVTVDFTPVYQRWLEKQWKRPEFAFVQEAFETFIASHYPVSRSIIRLEKYRRSQAFRDRFPYLTQFEAAEKLGIGTRFVARLVELNILVDFERGENVQRDWHARLKLVRRKELDALQTRWQPGIPLAEVALLLDVPDEMIEEFVEAGMLTMQATANEEPPVRRIGTASFYSFTSRLRQIPYPTVVFPNLNESMTLFQVIEMLEPYRYTTVQIIQHILSEEWRSEWFTAYLLQLRVSRATVETLIAKLQTE